MMQLLRQRRWLRRGFSMLWDAQSLTRVARPDQVVSMREFFSLARQWPEDLPASDGDALVVGGVEGCLDVLSADDAVLWLEEDLKRLILEYQDFYRGDAALILWLPSGAKRIHMTASTERYTWRLSAPHADQSIDLGRYLWGGAEADVARIIDTDDQKADYDGPAWVGLHHPRIS